LNTATFDLETSALEAVGAGFILCAVIKPHGKPPKTLRYDVLGCSAGEETKLIKRLVAELSAYDVLVGHNVERFDLPFIRTRAMILGVECHLRPILYDTLKAFRRCGYLSRQNGFGKPTASLAHVVDILGIPQKKTAVYPREWWKAIWTKHKGRRKEALDEIVRHCIADVVMNEKVFELLFSVDHKLILRRER
jgi:uncharacterized protein YprB with RNaseH-like and TPR domain